LIASSLTLFLVQAAWFKSGGFFVLKFVLGFLFMVNFDGFDSRQ